MLPWCLVLGSLELPSGPPFQKPNRSGFMRAEAAAGGLFPGPLASNPFSASALRHFFSRYPLKRWKAVEIRRCVASTASLALMSGFKVGPQLTTDHGQTAKLNCQRAQASAHLGNAPSDTLEASFLFLSAIALPRRRKRCTLAQTAATSTDKRIIFYPRSFVFNR